jgi:hypothetical protein
LTSKLKVDGSISGGTNQRSRLGMIEIYEVAKSEFTIAFPGNRKANADIA